MEILDFMESCYEQENKKTLYKPPVLCFDLLEEVGKQVEIKRNEIYQEKLNKHKEKFADTLDEIWLLRRNFDGAPLVSDFEENERNEENPDWVDAHYDENYGFIKEFITQYYITDAVMDSQHVNSKMPYWDTLGWRSDLWRLHKLVHGENK